MRDSIFWDCKWATGKDGVCSWAAEFKEVEGWTALRRDLIYGTTPGISYRVIRCPLFCKDSRIYTGDDEA